MSRIASFVTDNSRSAWAVAAVTILAGSLLAGWATRDVREAERLSALRLDSERRGIELMSQTLNGNLMGAISLIGLIDEDVRHDAAGLADLNPPHLSARLEAIGRAYGADGVFVVGGDGFVKSSWDVSGTPSTGIDVRFRPYYHMAIQGKQNVYAAISMARGDRALYFTAPVFPAAARSGEPVGAVVARAGLTAVDALLRTDTGISLLLAPQGVVFAGNRPDWIGFLAGEPTPARLAAIRALKQFGARFDSGEPKALPVPVNDGLNTADGRRWAVTRTRVRWNDPSGDWTLVMLEDLERTVPPGDAAVAALEAGALLLLIGLLSLALLRGRHRQVAATLRIADYARAQEASAARRTRMAEAARRFQQAKSASELAGLFFAEAHALLGALGGAVYVFATAGAASMELAGSYATPPGLAATLAPGAGLLGQCALDGEGRVLEIAGDESRLIRSGLGNSVPAAVMMAPLVRDRSTLGVVEIALLDPPDEVVRDQFGEMVTLLALNLEILRRHAPAIEVPS